MATEIREIEWKYDAAPGASLPDLGDLLLHTGDVAHPEHGVEGGAKVAQLGGEVGGHVDPGYAPPAGVPTRATATKQRGPSSPDAGSR